MLKAIVSLSYFPIVLRNKLINMYSKQLESLHDPKNIDSLLHIITNTPSLQRLSLVIPIASDNVLDDTKMKNMIIGNMETALNAIMDHFQNFRESASKLWNESRYLRIV
eukprot:859480_1